MSGILETTLTEARQYVANPADLDRLAVVMGASSAGSGLSPFFYSGSSAQASIGYGDGPDTLCQIIEQRQSNGQNTQKFPARFYTIPCSNVGSYGTIDVTGITGTAVVSVDSSSHPYGTDEARLLVVDGGIVGVAGITVKWSRDGGRTYSNLVALGVALSYTIPNSNDKFTFSPSTTNATYVTLAVELRADTLAHLANVTAHDAADTSAAQIALNASGVPATVTASTAVVNLVLAAALAHVTNIAAHDGPDLVAYTALSLLVAAVDTKTGIDLAVALKGIINTHEGVALAAVPAGLLGSTASIASPQTYTAVGSFLAGGVAAMDAQPRRPEFVISGGGTPADMADSVTITGFDYTGAAQIETALSLTGLGTVKATKAFKGTGLSCAFIAADGTAATFTIGYSNGVHNSADVTNLITSLNPTYGTLIAGDIAAVRTFAPTPSTSDIDTAFAALVSNAVNVGIIVLEFPITSSLLAHVTTGVNNLNTIGIRPTVLARTRLPAFETSETEAAWVTSVGTEFLNDSDSRVCIRAAYGLITDAMTTRQYLRSTLSQFAADVVRVDIKNWPSVPADQIEANVTLVNGSGVTVGHDEGARGSATGLSNDTLGNRFSCEQRLPDATNQEAVYNTVPWVLSASDDRVKNVMVRRVANAIERVAVAAAKSGLGADLDYTLADPTNPSSANTLTDTSRNAIQAVIYGALQETFRGVIQNADDGDIESGLVQVDPIVGVSGGDLLTVGVTIAPKVKGYLLKLNLTFAVKE